MGLADIFRNRTGGAPTPVETDASSAAPASPGADRNKTDRAKTDSSRAGAKVDLTRDDSAIGRGGINRKAEKRAHQRQSDGRQSGKVRREDTKEKRDRRVDNTLRDQESDRKDFSQNTGRADRNVGGGTLKATQGPVATHDETKFVVGERRGTAGVDAAEKVAGQVDSPDREGKRGDGAAGELRGQGRKDLSAYGIREGVDADPLRPGQVITSLDVFRRLQDGILSDEEQKALIGSKTPFSDYDFSAGSRELAAGLASGTVRDVSPVSEHMLVALASASVNLRMAEYRERTGVS